MLTLPLVENDIKQNVETRLQPFRNDQTCGLWWRSSALRERGAVGALHEGHRIEQFVAVALAGGLPGDSDRGRAERQQGRSKSRTPASGAVWSNWGDSPSMGNRVASLSASCRVVDQMQ